MSTAHETLRTSRVRAGLTQVRAARRLGVSQPYLSQLESGERALTDDLARAAAALYDLSPTLLPLPATPTRPAFDPDRLARQLGALGYPGFAHLRGRKANPAAVVLEALVQQDLDARLTEALPWLLAKYHDLDWSWLTARAKLADVQNRLGFVVGLARELAEQTRRHEALARLSSVERALERSRLARQDTLCRESMPEFERGWLARNRSVLAEHWNLLTGLTSDQLTHSA